MVAKRGAGEIYHITDCVYDCFLCHVIRKTKPPHPQRTMGDKMRRWVCIVRFTGVSRERGLWALGILLLYLSLEVSTHWGFSAWGHVPGDCHTAHNTLLLSRALHNTVNQV